MCYTTKIDTDCKSYQYNMIFRRFTGVFFISTLLLINGSCKVLKFSNPEKKALKQEQKESEQLQKAYRQEVKAHYKMQSIETKKRMKKNYSKVRKEVKAKNYKSGWNCN